MPDPETWDQGAKSPLLEFWETQKKQEEDLCDVTRVYGWVLPVPEKLVAQLDNHPENQEILHSDELVPQFIIGQIKTIGVVILRVVTKSEGEKWESG